MPLDLDRIVLRELDRCRRGGRRQGATEGEVLVRIEIYSCRKRPRTAGNHLTINRGMPSL